MLLIDFRGGNESRQAQLLSWPGLFAVRKIFDAVFHWNFYFRILIPQHASVKKYCLSTASTTCQTSLSHLKSKIILFLVTFRATRPTPTIQCLVRRDKTTAVTIRGSRAVSFFYSVRRGVSINEIENSFLRKTSLRKETSRGDLKFQILPNERGHTKFQKNFFGCVFQSSKLA